MSPLPQYFGLGTFLRITRCLTNSAPDPTTDHRRRSNARSLAHSLMLRSLTRPPTRNFTKRLLTTNVGWGPHPVGGEKGKLFDRKSSSRADATWLSGGSHVRRSRLVGNRQVDGRPGTIPPTHSLRSFLSCAAGSRVTMLLDFSCGTGTRETNPGPIKGVNGKRIGRTYAWCPGT